MANILFQPFRPVTDQLKFENFEIERSDSRDSGSVTG